MYKKVNHDLSYAHSAHSRLGMAVIRCLENATGKSAVLSRSQNLRTNIHSIQSFWHSIMEGYGVTVDIMQGELGDIPVDQPFVLVANHPYGILDGLVMGSVLAQSGANFKIIANDIFNKAREISDKILPISFKNTREAISLNLRTRKNALTHLSNGGAIGIFPGGTVSTSSKLFSQPADPAWRSFTAKMIFKSNALVVPIFFDGNTSRIFQLASHLHPNIRAGLLLREFKLRLDKPVRIVIGKPIPRCRMDLFKNDSRKIMDFLRLETYKLSPNKNQTFDYGYEFKHKHRNIKV
jgi:putative hemolysin